MVGILWHHRECAWLCGVLWRRGNERNGKMRGKNWFGNLSLAGISPRPQPTSQPCSLPLSAGLPDRPVSAAAAAATRHVGSQRLGAGPATTAGGVPTAARGPAGASTGPVATGEPAVPVRAIIITVLSSCYSSRFPCLAHSPGSLPLFLSPRPLPILTRFHAESVLVLRPG